MWNQWLICWLSRCPQTSRDDMKQKMVEQCRKSCSNKPILLGRIEEFLRDCTEETVVQWYTKDSFLYRQMNQALRQEDADLTSKFQYFIILLHEKLQKLAIEQQDQPETVFFRGQRLNENELEKLKANVGNYITINAPLSTTRQEDVARGFVADALRAVLFKICIEGDNPDGRRHFADIAHLSDFPSEEEVLLVAATIFRIDSVEQENDSTWLIELSLENRLMNRMNQVADSVVKSLADKSNLIEIHLITDDLCLFARYYQSLANRTLSWMEGYAFSVDSDALQLFDTLGDRQKSITFYQNLLENKTFIDQHKSIVLHIIIANNYSRLQQYGRALEYYGKALSLLDDHHRVTGELYHHLGDLWRDMEYYDNALACYGNSLSILQQCLEPRHMVPILEKMSDVYGQQGCWEEAHIYETEACHIGGTDRFVASSNLDRSIDYHRSQLLNTSNRSSLQLINTLYAIGLCHLREREYDQALNCLLQVKKQLETSLHSDRSIGRVQYRLCVVLAWVCLLQE